MQKPFADPSILMTELGVGWLQSTPTFVIVIRPGVDCLLEQSRRVLSGGRGGRGGGGRSPSRTRDTIAGGHRDHQNQQEKQAPEHG